MSHFTYIKTSFQNLFYLKKALNRLNIVHKEKESNTESLTKNLVIPQSNNYDIEFVWNGQKYEMVVDMSYWEQAYPIESFIDKVAQQYAGEVIIGESQKTDFQTVNYKQNVDGSNTLILERWNNDKILTTIS